MHLEKSVGQASAGVGDEGKRCRTKRYPDFQIENGLSKTNEKDDRSVCTNRCGQRSPPRYFDVKKRQKESVE